MVWANLGLCTSRDRHATRLFVFRLSSVVLFLFFCSYYDIQLSICLSPSFCNSEQVIIEWIKLWIVSLWTSTKNRENLRYPVDHFFDFEYTKIQGLCVRVIRVESNECWVGDSKHGVPVNITRMKITVKDNSTGKHIFHYFEMGNRARGWLLQQVVKRASQRLVLQVKPSLSE